MELFITVVTLFVFFEMEDKEKNHRNIRSEEQSLNFQSFDVERMDEWISHKPSKKEIKIENEPLVNALDLIEEENMD